LTPHVSTVTLFQEVSAYLAISVQFFLGPVTQGYESYVKSIFKPSETNPEMPPQLLQSKTELPVGASALSGNPKVSASALLKMEEFLGKDALGMIKYRNFFSQFTL
jgi:hypothetical protein